MRNTGYARDDDGKGNGDDSDDGDGAYDECD